MNIKIYSTTNCKYCVQLKEWFKERNIPYVEIDASQPDKRKEMIELSGQMGVPVSVINKEVVVGFNPDKITTVLGL